MRNTPEPAINPDRLLGDLRDLAAIGAMAGGVRRLAFSADDLAARRWLAQRFEAAGLEATIDRVGNVFGRNPQTSRALLVGSHSDTVPTGGWLDGSLGVIYALEIARALSEAGRTSTIGVDVVSFADEEGTFAGWFGSRSFCGEIDRDFPDRVGSAGLRAALAPLEANPEQRLDRARYIGYFESHIEQGPRLEASDKQIGIVTSIVGIRNRHVTFHGRADHAGTTPMAMRHDAGALMFRFISRLLDRFEQVATPETVWNIGNALMLPGAQNVVPFKAEFLLQYRDPTLEMLHVLDGIVDAEVARENATRPGICECTTGMATKPVTMDPGFQRAIGSAATELGYDHEFMASGAGHDAAALAGYLPVGMLFVPSIGGRSHTYDENTKDADIVAGARVALRAVEKLIENA
jgi:N-carbamoyl-L-amino-acid hydrolase